MVPHIGMHGGVLSPVLERQVRVSLDLHPRFIWDDEMPSTNGSMYRAQAGSNDNAPLEGH